MNDKPYTLLLGDCLEKMKDIPDGSIDMILCDLPYGTTACKWDAVIPFDRLWTEYKRATKKGAAIVLTASQPFTSALVMSNPKWFRHEWIWHKNRGTNPFAAKYAPMKRHESVLVFGTSKVAYYPQTRKGKPYRGFSSETATIGEVYGDGKSVHKDNPEGLLLPITVQEVACEFGLHPTQKPVVLMEYLIKTYTNEGQTVLDNCFGSCSTGVACLNTNRCFIGIERDETYFAVGSKRMEEVWLTKNTNESL